MKSKWIHNDFTVDVPYSEAVNNQRTWFDAQSTRIVFPMNVHTPQQVTAWADAATKPIADNTKTVCDSLSVAFGSFLSWSNTTSASLDRRRSSINKAEALWQKVAAAAKI